MNLTQLLAAVQQADAEFASAIGGYVAASQDVDAKTAARDDAQTALDNSNATLTEKSDAAAKARKVLDDALDAAKVIIPA